MEKNIKEKKKEIEGMIQNTIEKFFNDGVTKRFDVGLPATNTLIRTMIDTAKHGAKQLVSSGKVTIDMNLMRIYVPEDFEPNVLAALPYAVPEMVYQTFDVFCDGEKYGEVKYGGEIAPHIDGMMLCIGFETTFSYTLYEKTFTLDFADEEKDTES